MPLIELNPAICTRLEQYFNTAPPLHNALRTDHWATFGAQNRISFAPQSQLVKITGGSGFDDFYSLNFKPQNLMEWLRQKWTLWRTVGECRRFCDAFKEVSAHNLYDLHDAQKILGGPFTPHKALATYYINLIAPSISDMTSLYYLEIGAGSGYLTALLHKTFSCRAIIVDLPEIIPFSFIYLSKLFPRATFQLPHEARATSLIDKSVNFVFLTPDQLHLIPDQTVQLAANTASFGEMMPQQIAIYFDMLRRAMAPDGIFFTCNRLEKIMASNSTNIDSKGTEEKIPIRFDNYPWQSGDQDIFYGLSEMHNLVQPQNPVLRRLCRLSLT